MFPHYRCGSRRGIQTLLVSNHLWKRYAALPGRLLIEHCGLSTPKVLGCKRSSIE